MIKRVLIILFFVISMGFWGAIGSDSLLFVKKIEFRGLRNLDKNEVMNNVQTDLTDDGIIIDANSLSASLSNNILIEDYRISRNGSTLIIEIDEKYPVFNFLITKGQNSKPCMVSANLDFINSGIFFKTDMPILIMSDELFFGNPGYLKNLMASLIRLKKTRPVFLDELLEITLNPGGEMEVALRKRSTHFIINNGPDDFFKLEKAVAFLDVTGIYPESLDIRNHFVLVK